MALLIHTPAPPLVDMTRDAVLTVSPKTSYINRSSPITPPDTGPQCRPATVTDAEESPKHSSARSATAVGETTQRHQMVGCAGIGDGGGGRKRSDRQAIGGGVTMLLLHIIGAACSRRVR